MKKPIPMLRVVPTLALLAVISSGSGPLLGAQTPKAPALESLPGYVDFSDIPFLDPEDLAVEINLGGSLLGILANSLGDDESEFSDLVSKLRSIRVSIFDLEDEDVGEVQERTLALSQKLIDDGWEAIVRIRDEGEAIQILIRYDEEKISGLAAMFVEEGDSAGFINIVGELDPAQVARIGRQLNIDALEVMEEAVQNHDDAVKREDGR